MIRPMSTPEDNAREIALRARAEAAERDTAAARAVVRQLEIEVRRERYRARMLAAQLAGIAAIARRGSALACDERARDILGSIAISAGTEPELRLIVAPASR
jgi:hypothetical protein